MAKKEKSSLPISRKVVGLIDNRHTDNDGLLIQRDRSVTMLDLFGGSEQKAAVAHFVSELLAKGFNNQQIIETVKIKYGLEWKMRHVNVMKDLLHKLWRCETAHTMNDQIAREIATIDVQLKEAWEAWEFSKKGIKHEKKRTTNSTSPSDEMTYDLEEIITDTDTCAGDVKYLQHINELGKERRKLLGLYAPEKKDNTPKANAIQLNIVGQGAGAEAASIMGAILGQGAPQQVIPEAEVVEEKPVEVQNEGSGVDLEAFFNEFMED